MKTSQQKHKLEEQGVLHKEKKKMKKKPPKEPFFQVKTDVRNILRLGENEHNKMLFEAGMYWLEKNPQHSNRFINENKNSRVFWNWFKEQFYTIDQSFVNKIQEEGLYKEDSRELLKYYKCLHKNLGVVPLQYPINEGVKVLK